MCMLVRCSHETHSCVPSAQVYIVGCFSVYCAYHIFKRFFQAKTSSSLKHVSQDPAFRLGVCFFVVVAGFLGFFFLLKAVCMFYFTMCVLGHNAK